MNSPMNGFGSQNDNQANFGKVAKEKDANYRRATYVK